MTGIRPTELEFVPGEVLIRLKDDRTVDDLVQIITDAKPQLNLQGFFLPDNFLSFRERFQYSNLNVWRLKFNGAEFEHKLHKFIEWLNNLNIVLYAEPNYIGYIAVDDRYYTRQWNFGSAGINVEAAWKNYPEAGRGVVVAVLDTGAGYADGDGRKKAKDFKPNTFMAPLGSDIVNNDDFPLDDHGHGTHVAGTIAQATNNQIGVAGVAYECTILPVKVVQANGICFTSDVAKGIDYAREHQANVINLSLTFDYESGVIENALEQAYKAGITIVAAAGNKGKKRRGIAYPASSEYCIAVGAINEFGTRADFSQYGEGVDFVAPGCDILQETYMDWEEDEYGGWRLVPGQTTPTFTELNGTSMATPHVSGLAALIIAQGVIDPENVKKVLQETAIPLGAPEEYGYGLVNGKEPEERLENLLLKYTATAYKPNWGEDITREGLSKSPKVAWDVNGDGEVDISDLVLVGSHFGEEGKDIKGDTNGDGQIDITDLVLVGSHLGELIED